MTAICHVLLLTAPERYILALCLHDNWGHCHSNWDGIKVWRVGCQREDGCFCRQCPSPFHRHPMETTRKPHDPHDDLQNYVHQSEKDAWQILSGPTENKTTGFSLSVADESFACLSPMGHIWGFSRHMPRLGLTRHVNQSQQGFALTITAGPPDWRCAFNWWHGCFEKCSQEQQYYWRITTNKARYK